jgi:hypothetical protein
LPWSMPSKRRVSLSMLLQWLRLAGSDSPELQRSVLACLAELGHPDSYKILSAAASASKYMPEPTNATGSLLAYAETMTRQNDPALSLKICKQGGKKM